MSKRGLCYLPDLSVSTGVVGAAYIGTALDMGKTELKGFLTQMIEHFGLNVFLHRKMMPAGSQILADTEIGTSDPPQVMEKTMQIY